jgi:hypothetical protein
MSRSKSPTVYLLFGEGFKAAQENPLSGKADLPEPG